MLLVNIFVVSAVVVVVVTEAAQAAFWAEVLTVVGIVVANVG